MRRDCRCVTVNTAKQCKQLLLLLLSPLLTSPSSSKIHVVTHTTRDVTAARWQQQRDLSGVAVTTEMMIAEWTAGGGLAPARVRLMVSPGRRRDGKRDGGIYTTFFF